MLIRKNRCVRCREKIPPGPTLCDACRTNSPKLTDEEKIVGFWRGFNAWWRNHAAFDAYYAETRGVADAAPSRRWRHLPHWRRRRSEDIPLSYDE